MGKHFQIQNEFRTISESVQDFILNFNSEGKTIYKGSRNQLKSKFVGECHVNIKRFNTPNLINRLVYRRFRKSKAERSFLHAKFLLECGVGTPKPIAFQENYSILGIKESFYVSIHEDYDFTFRDLIINPKIQDREQVLEAFTSFTFKMHENHILFLDHSPGNTLIKRKPNGGYAFYLVDLNRMQFKKLSFVERVKNFERLSLDPDIVKIMGSAYAKLTQRSKSEVIPLMQDFAVAYSAKFARKKNLKNKMKFWKN
jgi:hypothetical protein